MRLAIQIKKEKMDKVFKILFLGVKQIGLEIY